MRHRTNRYVDWAKILNFFFHKVYNSFIETFDRNSECSCPAWGPMARRENSCSRAASPVSWSSGESWLEIIIVMKYLKVVFTENSGDCKFQSSAIEWRHEGETEGEGDLHQPLHRDPGQGHKLRHHRDQIKIYTGHNSSGSYLRFSSVWHSRSTAVGSKCTLSSRAWGGSCTTITWPRPVWGWYPSSLSSWQLLSM